VAQQLESRLYRRAAKEGRLRDYGNNKWTYQAAIVVRQQRARGHHKPDFFKCLQNIRRVGGKTRVGSAERSNWNRC